SVVALRFDGPTARRTSSPDDGWLVSVLGHDGGPLLTDGGPFAMTCLIDASSWSCVPAIVQRALAPADPTVEPHWRFAGVLTRGAGRTPAFAAGGAGVS